MTTLATIVDHLTASVTGHTVSAPVPGNSLMKNKENAMALFTALSSMFPAKQVSPLHAQQDGALPEALYGLAEVGATDYAGVEVSHVSAFHVSVRATTYKQLTEKVDEIEAYLQNQAGYDVVDSAEAYDDLRTAYRADLAIDICRPTADVVVIELSNQIIGNGFMGKNCTDADYQTAYAVVHHAVDNDALTTLRALTEAELHNYRPTDHNAMILQGGEMLPAAGGLCAWVNTYTHQTQ